MTDKKNIFHPHRPDEPPSEQEIRDEIEEAIEEAPKMVSISAEELEGLRNQVEEFKDKYLRVLAEMENGRKRMLKERQEYVQYAIGDAIAGFLPPLDNFESALGFASGYSEEVKNWAIGFQMILSQFNEALSSQGVDPIITKGVLFDPHCHEAIEMIETDEFSDGTIVEECTRGYKMGDKTLRPSRVKVAKKK
jgi:molecular chaperone GrpE